MSDTIAAHYKHLAQDYDGNWEHSAEYVEWMNGMIAETLDVQPGERVADIGGGTGLFDRGLLHRIDPETPLLCVDPIKDMLDQVPADPRIRTVLAGAEEVAEGSVALPYPQLEVILVKETIHHVADVPRTVRELSGLLAPGGRMLIISLPPRLEYPLFQAALDRFAERHPEPETIASGMRDGGLDTTVDYHEFNVSVDREHYIRLVQHNKWMSVLYTFSDEELAAGAAEMRAKHPEETLRFIDRFAFVYGRRPQA